MNRLSVILFAGLLASSGISAQGLTAERIDALRDAAETATAAAVSQSYTAPDPDFTRLADSKVECKRSKVSVKDEVIQQYRNKFRGTKVGEAILRREPSWNNARLCYYAIAVAYYGL